MKQEYIIALCFLVFAILLHGCAHETPRPENTEGTRETTPEKITVKTDAKSIQAGRLLFMQKCEYCHDPYSTMTLGGPGLKGILKNPLLPVSKRPATPENIASQMRHPFSNMPSFVYLHEDDVENIIAFLNTL